MPIVADKAAIRARLNSDRAWSVYALGDLAPRLFEHTAWHAAQNDDALLMLFSAFELPVLFTIGAAGGIERLLDEINAQAKLFLSIRGDILPLIHGRYEVSHETAMWRMVLDEPRFVSRRSRAVRLTPADYPSISRLRADGQAAEEAPDFFAPYMVEQGVFYGIFEDHELTSMAGTHLVAPREGVAAVGNVYTRPDRRGHGLASEVTSAVVAELVRIMPPRAIIALNVMQTNAAAVKVYERLGFTRHCGFYEGLAARAPR